MQHKVTLPLLFVLSVVWTGFSAFKSVKRESEQPNMYYLEAATPSPSVHLASYKTNDERATTPFSNDKLIAHIMDWVGTPHKDNRNTKNGTDCSGFVQAVFQDTYGIQLSRSSKEMYSKDVWKIKKAQLREGDLVFFNTYGQGVSHVGIYLKEGKFAHTSSSKGVTVSSLHEKYYQKNYLGAGRVKIDGK